MNPGVLSPGFSKGLSGPPKRAASCARRSSSLSLFRFLSKIMRHTTQAMNKVPTTLAVIVPILALVTTSLVPVVAELAVDDAVAVLAVLM